MEELKEKKKKRVDYGEAWRNMKCSFFFFWGGGGGGEGRLSNQVSISGVFKKIIWLFHFQAFN